MEFCLQPFYKGKANVTVKTPYLCTERYDGSRWSDYPDRKGQQVLSLPRDRPFNELRAIRYLGINEPPLYKQEAFLQLWLYFGLLAEFLGANYTGDPHDGLEERFSDPATSKSILDTIYETVLVEDGYRTIVVLTNDGLQTFVHMLMATMAQDAQARNARYLYLNRCLAHAHAILNTIAPKAMNNAVRISIAALGDVLTCIVRYGLRGSQDNIAASRTWAKHFFDNEAKRAMVENGWCPSDISRCQTKFMSTQSLYIIWKMDKSLPRRDHSRCTDYVCSTTQIDLENYQVGHGKDDCMCTELVIDSDEITRVLFDGDKIPLLRFVGGLEDLRAEIVESTPDSKYIAISHVWADGLGNPKANALHRCRLNHLRDLVAGVAREADESQDSENENQAAPLIWIDTLCCPAKEGFGKNKGIEKLFSVYAKAEHVLVLDSGLMSYAAQDQAISEQTLRIFTSTWVRRLWTLQEGALARSLYFQFADRAVSLQSLYKIHQLDMAGSLQQQSMSTDFAREYWHMRRFFHVDNVPDGALTRAVGYLDRCLQFRGVSVATDEPLCIGTLLRLDTPRILRVVPTGRMQMVWKLLAESSEGLPAAIIFFEETRIDADGWRWAPRSLLDKWDGLLPPDTRVLGWAGKQCGTLTTRGLRVKFSGYRIKIRPYMDDMPRNPWPGFPRIAESNMNFKDTLTGQWYFVGDRVRGLISQGRASEKERLEYARDGAFPLHDLADTDDSLIICNPAAGHSIFVTPDRSSTVEAGDEGALHVRARRQIIVAPLDAEFGHIFNTIEENALRLRADRLTVKHVEIFKRLEEESGGASDVLGQKMVTDEEFKASLDALKQKMKDTIAEIISRDAKFVEAVRTSLGDSFLDDVWALISNYFRHGYAGSPLGPDQTWVVD